MLDAIPTPFTGKVHPMLLNPPMVRATLREIAEPGAGKTVTRRLITKQAARDALAVFGADFLKLPGNRDLLVYAPGDLIYVRETWAPGYYHDPDAIDDIPKVSVIYDADKAEALIPAPSYDLAEEWSDRYSGDGPDDPVLRPSIHMPRWTSRLTLHVTEVTVERLGDITEEDAIREGLSVFNEDGNFYFSGVSSDWFGQPDQWFTDPVDAFATLWDSTKPKPGFRWEDNPWVIRIAFRPEHANVVDVLARLGAEVAA